MFVKRLSWIVIALVPFVVVASMQLVGAAPVRQGEVLCEWVSLDRGESRSQHTLATVFGTGVIGFGGVERTSRAANIKDDTHVLDLSGGAPGAWDSLSTDGASPGDRADHMSVSRDSGGTTTMYTYGGIDELPAGGGGGTFTWRSPVTAGGVPYDGLRGAFAPRDVVRNGYALEIGETAATWSPMSVAGGGPLADASAVWVEELASVVMFGGRKTDEANSVDNAISSINVETSEWSSDKLPGSPTARFAHSAVYDPVGEQMIVFGGTRNWNSGLNDTWALDLSSGIDGATWEELDPDGSAPGRRYDQTAVYVPGLHWMVMFGGTRNGSNNLDDVWALDLNTEFTTWNELDPSGSSPASVSAVQAAWSDAGGMAIFYGGENAGSSKRDTWGLRCASPATPTPEVTDTPVPTATMVPSETPVATDTPSVTDTPGPTDTPVPPDTPEASPVPETIEIFMPRALKNK